MTQDEVREGDAEQLRNDAGRHSDVARDVGTSAVRRRLLTSGVFLAAQVSTTDYGAGADAGTAALFWFAVGAALLWLVYRRRSRVARGIVVVLSLTGAAIYALGALESGRAAVLVVAFAGQALPLLTAPVRRHVRHVRPRR